MNVFDLQLSRLKRMIYLYKEKKRWKHGLYLSHVTYGLAGNSGDTALSWCVRRLFSLNKIASKWNIINVTAQVNPKIINDINKTKCLIIGGGGLFIPDTNNNNISGWQWAISKEQLHIIHPPIIIFSVGYNYFPGQLPNTLFKDSINTLLKESSFFGLRNTGSVKAVKCLVDETLTDKILYQPCITTIIRKIYTLPPKVLSNTIAFNLAFDRSNIRFGGNKDEIIRKIIVAMRKIKQRGYKVIVVAHMPEDLEILSYTDEFESVDTSRFLPQKLFEFYNGIDMVIGMRGHAQMIPFGVNCEILSLCSHDKMKWFLEDISSPDWGIDIRCNIQSLDNEIVKKFIEIHEKDHDRTKKRLAEAQENLFSITMNNLTKIERIICE